MPRLARYRYRLARATVQFVRCLRLLQKMSWPQYAALYLITLGYWLPRYLLLFFIIHLVGQADGGMHLDTLGGLAAAGVDALVSGSDLFNDKPAAENARRLKELMHYPGERGKFAAGRMEGRNMTPMALRSILAGFI